MEKAPLSVVIIAKNEETRLEGALRSVVDWADEIVVLDDNSTDGTRELARRYTDKVFQREMKVEGQHRNYAYSLARNEWVLSLDADERVEPELAVEITETLKDTSAGHVCYSMPMKNYLGDEWIAGAGYYPAAKSKLFKKSEYRYDEDQPVHPRVMYKGTCGKLKGHLIHHSFRDMEHLINKFNRETTLEAGKWVHDNRKVKPATIVRKSIDRFFKAYALKGGWKLGITGYLMCILHGFYHVVAYKKYLELKSKSKNRENVPPPAYSPASGQTAEKP